MVPRKRSHWIGSEGVWIGVRQPERNSNEHPVTVKDIGDDRDGVRDMVDLDPVSHVHRVYF